MRPGPAALVLCLVASALADDETARHQGTWAVTSSVRDGKEAPADVVASIQRVVKEDHVTWTRGGKSFAGTRVEIRRLEDTHAHST